MQNDADGQPNIAFRVSTFHNLVDSLLASMTEAQVEIQPSLQRNQVLVKSGYFCGKDFAQELNEHFSKEDTVKKRLEEWAAFDTGVGFGSITLEDPFDAEHIIGYFSIKGDAFRPRKTADGTNDWQDDLRSFFSGYLQGVLEYVIPEDQFDSSKGTFKVDCLPSQSWPTGLSQKYLETKTDVSVYSFQPVQNTESV